MRPSKSIRISFIILMIESFVAMFYSISAFIMPQILVSRSFKIYTGKDWDTFFNGSPDLANYVMLLEGAAGGMGFAVIVANLFVLITSFRKGEKWAWFFVLVVSMTGWGVDLITNILLHNSFSV